MRRVVILGRRLQRPVDALHDHTETIQAATVVLRRQRLGLLETWKCKIRITKRIAMTRFVEFAADGVHLRSLQRRWKFSDSTESDRISFSRCLARKWVATVLPERIAALAKLVTRASHAANYEPCSSELCSLTAAPCTSKYGRIATVSSRGSGEGWSASFLRFSLSFVARGAFA